MAFAGQMSNTKKRQAGNH